MPQHLLKFLGTNLTDNVVTNGGPENLRLNWRNIFEVLVQQGPGDGGKRVFRC